LYLLESGGMTQKYSASDYDLYKIANWGTRNVLRRWLLEKEEGRGEITDEKLQIELVSEMGQQKDSLECDSEEEDVDEEDEEDSENSYEDYLEDCDFQLFVKTKAEAEKAGKDIEVTLKKKPEYFPVIRSNMLYRVTPREQFRLLGERLFPQVLQEAPDDAKLLTGMMLGTLQSPAIGWSSYTLYRCIYERAELLDKLKVAQTCMSKNLMDFAWVTKKNKEMESKNPPEVWTFQSYNSVLKCSDGPVKCFFKVI